MVDSDENRSAGGDGTDDSTKVSRSTPDEQSIDEPTQNREQEASETAWMMKEGVSIGVISILALLLLALALMQFSGLIDLLSPVADTGLGQWSVFAVLALAVVALFAWSRWGV
ncbi:hypothetical protein [Halomontanus rarus]|uniref:hypothetical protein n=1 Tax=Halomontanus rarus TaxID=3034020 RepID=UPI0023E8BD13|nr:hypothetical protein [Halovivax sp. TS33]